MSDKGFNKTGISFPGHDKKIKNHSTFKNFFDPNIPEKTIKPYAFRKFLFNKKSH